MCTFHPQAMRSIAGGMGEQCSPIKKQKAGPRPHKHNIAIKYKFGLNDPQNTLFQKFS